MRSYTDPEVAFAFSSHQRALRRTDAALAALAELTARRIVRADVEEVKRGALLYDRNRILPRVLLGGVVDAASAADVLRTPRATVIASLRRLIRHQREGLAAGSCYADRTKLVSARMAYVAERLAALRDRATAEQRLRDARAA